MRIQDGQVTILGCLFQYNSAEDVSFVLDCNVIP